MHDETRSLVDVTGGAGPTPASIPTEVGIQPGDCLGRYTVGQRIGGGGIGEVFAAHDPELDRTVALKVLRPEIAGGSPAARARFQREAQAMARLNHPNVVQVFDVGTFGERVFVALELVEGPTLAAWLAERPRGWREIADVFLQAGRGLVAAHAAGIVHRDFKPANVILGERVRVADFGLARTVRELDAAGGPAITPLDAAVTQAGQQPGTPAYMSPEQRAGKPATAASDQYAFAVALHEALYGARPGERMTAPRPVPGWLRAIVARALAPRPEDRYPTMAQLLAGLAHDRDADRRRRWTIPAGLVLAAGLGIYLATSREPAVPFQNFSLTQVTDTGDAQLAAISPDGKYTLDVQNDHGEQSLWLRNVSTGRDVQIAPPAASEYFSGLVFSPNGDEVYFLKSVAPGVRNLYRRPVRGGTAQLVANDVDSNVAFSPDGRRIAYTRGNYPDPGKFRLLAANPDGSHETVLELESIKAFGNQDFWRSISWSIDGSSIAGSAGQFAASAGLISAFDLDSKHENVIGRLAGIVVFEVAWLSSDLLLITYAEKGSESGRRQIGVVSVKTGKLLHVTRDTNSYSGLTLSADKKTIASVQVKTASALELVPAPSRDGAPTVPRLNIKNVRVFDWAANGSVIASDGSRLTRIGPDGIEQSASVSDRGPAILGVATCPNGDVIVSWANRGTSEGSSIWRIYDDGSNAVQLTHGAHDTSPACSPDGTWVYYLDNLLTFERVRSEGGEPEVIPDSKVPDQFENLGGVDISRDGRRLLFNALVSSGQLTRVKLAIVNLDATPGSGLTTVDPDPRIAAPLYTGGARFTPDGHAVAYAITGNGAWNLWVQPLDGSPGRQITDGPSGRITDFRWSPDGKTLAVTREHDTSDVVVLREMNL